MKQAKRRQFSDCKIFGKKGLMYILFTANLKNKGRIHLALLKKGKVVKTLQTITAKSKFSALKGNYYPAFKCINLVLTKSEFGKQNRLISFDKGHFEPPNVMFN